MNVLSGITQERISKLLSVSCVLHFVGNLPGMKEA